MIFHLSPSSLISIFLILCSGCLDSYCFDCPSVRLPPRSIDIFFLTAYQILCTLCSSRAPSSLLFPIVPCLQYPTFLLLYSSPLRLLNCRSLFPAGRRSTPCFPTAPCYSHDPGDQSFLCSPRTEHTIPPTGESFLCIRMASHLTLACALDYHKFGSIAGRYC